MHNEQHLVCITIYYILKSSQFKINVKNDDEKSSYTVQKHHQDKRNRVFLLKKYDNCHLAKTKLTV